MAAEYLTIGRLTVRTRQPGDRLRPVGARNQRTLKNLFQENAVPLWERTGTPVLCVDGRIAWVAGIGVAAEFAAQNGPKAALGILPVWHPKAPMLQCGNNAAGSRESRVKIKS